ncbi:heme lyase CcmF/NrfE family subunit [soil metagenome]
MATLGYGLARRRPNLLRVGHNYAWLVLAGALLAFVFMERALITRDFSLEYVARNGSSRTPAVFNFATLWAALEGSIILWSLVLSGDIAVTARNFRDRLTDPLVGWALLTMLAVATFFFGLMLDAANPFTTLANPPLDGPGPNPLLQNHVLMAFHPPMLYLGYVGFTVPFAFAVAALATGRLGEGWLVETRRWTLFAWGFLTVGIILGAWWSYEVLGWGGYWAWDPVENASFLPWLTGTAYLHSVMVQERRGMLRAWNLSLLCATFSLTILGTFLTRSGVLDSVHAFTESPIGPLLLGFFGVVVAVTIGLIAWRGDRLRSPGRIDSPLSREGAFLANNLVFAAFAFVVLLGTVWPLVVESLNGSQISIGVPFFDFWAQPIGLTLLFLMAVAPVLPWRKASSETLGQRLHWPAWAGTAGLVLAVALGGRGLTPLLTFGLGGFAAGAAVRQIALATRRQGWRGFMGRTNGGMVVHLGVILIAVAVAASGSYSTEAEARLSPGESATVGGHTVTYLGSRTETRSEKIVVSARVQIDGGPVYEPALNTFITSEERSSGQAIGTPSVRTGITGDVFLSLLTPPDAGDTVTLRVVIQPLIVWLWIGGGVMAFGTVLAAWPGRRRRPTEPVSALVPAAASSAPEAADSADSAAPDVSEPEPAGVGTG